MQIPCRNQRMTVRTLSLVAKNLSDRKAKKGKARQIKSPRYCQICLKRSECLQAAKMHADNKLKQLHDNFISSGSTYELDPIKCVPTPHRQRSLTHIYKRAATNSTYAITMINWYNAVQHRRNISTKTTISDRHTKQEVVIMSMRWVQVWWKNSRRLISIQILIIHRAMKCRHENIIMLGSVGGLQRCNR